MGNLDAVRDWGYAPEYVEGMWRMLQTDEPDDFVLATGRGFTVREFARAAFEHAGLDWQQYVKFDQRYLRPTEVDSLIGDATKAAELLGWRSALLTGPLEPTNDAYAIAKIAGILAVQAVRRQHGLPWISAMPTNLYGPGDNFSPSGSHLLPALIRRYDEAKASGAPNVTNWGTGTPRRELLHVDDLASACLYLLEHFDGPTHVNVGTGIDHTIGEIAEMVASAVGYSGETRWDPSKPDGTPRKLLDVSVLREAGWRPSIALRDGIEATVAWYREHAGTVRQ